LAGGVSVEEAYGESYVKEAIPDVPLCRGALTPYGSAMPKRMPAIWCKLVVEALRK